MAAAATQRPLDAISAPHNLHLPSSTIQVSTGSTRSYKPRDVTTTLNYYLPNADGSPPEPSYVGRPETYIRPVEPHTAIVHDIRGSEVNFSLDKTGFEIVKLESKEKEFVDEDAIKNVYYKEVEELLKKATGGNRVFIFDHTVRRATPSTPQAISLRGPVQRVHIDQSYNAGPSRVKHHLPELADELLQGRYQIINVWKPIRTIRKDPLAVAEARSVKEDELVPVGLIYPDREGETFTVKYSSGHKWYYLNEQTPEEVLLIKCFDSKVDGRARRVPHTSFVDSEREGEDTRESLEVRALVFG